MAKIQRSPLIAKHGQCWEPMQDVEIVGYLTQCDNICRSVPQSFDERRAFLRLKVVNSAKSSASRRCMRVVFRTHMYRSAQETHLSHCGGVAHHFCDVIAASTISPWPQSQPDPRETARVCKFVAVVICGQIEGRETGARCEQGVPGG